MRKIFPLIALIFLTGFQSLAQTTAKVSGTVNDDAGKGLASATVSLLRAKDSGLVKLAVSGRDGAYEFVNIKEGAYLLAVTSVGYGKKYSAPFSLSSSDVSVPALSLLPSAKDLNAVTVSARKPFIESKLDRTIVNVEASPTSAGSTALEVLEKSPGIMVNNDGAISLRGKQGVIVMMDGKPTSTLR